MLAERIQGIQRQAWVLMFLGAVGCALGMAHNTEQFFHSYLYGYLVFFGITSGCLGLTLLFLLVGGAWGRAARVVLQPVTLALPLMAVLFIPVLLGLHHIYPWTNPEYCVEGAMAGHKRAYFNVPFFIGRAVFYFIIRGWMAYRARRYSNADVTLSKWGAQALGSIGLVVYFLTVSMAAFDWIMSLEPYWSSSVYGGLVIIGHGVSAFSFTIAALYWLHRQDPTSLSIKEDTCHDLGNLLLAFCMLWAYLELSQYLIIWCGNLPDEITWYLSRGTGSWRVITTILFLCQFFLPFALLLGRERKRHLDRLVRVAVFIMAVRLIDVYWLVVPEFSPHHVAFHWLDLAALLTVGGGWAGMVSGGLRREVKA